MEVRGAMSSVKEDTQSSNIQRQGKRHLKLWGRTALAALFVFGLILSVAFPFGIGFAVFIWIIALVGAICGVGAISYNLLKEMLGTTATFGYSPNAAYMAGKNTKKRKKDETSEPEEDKDESN